MTKEYDFFNGQAYMRMKLTPELIVKGILDISINKQPRQFSITYRHENQQMKPLIVPVLEFPYPTVDQLDKMVNGSMSLETLTYLKAYIIKKYPQWNKINNSDNGEIEKTEREKAKIQMAIEVSKKDIQQLFIDEYNSAYAAIPIEGHLQIFPINSKSFKNWLRKIYYQEKGTILDSPTINDICDFLTANSEFDGKQIPLSLRTASISKNNQLQWVYDLTNNYWEFIKITVDGWYIFNNSIIFRRYNIQQSQVYPSKEYEPDIFDRFMNLVNVMGSDDDTILLLKCYIISLFIPDIQKVVLMLHGSGGSAKTFLQELIKALVDPSIIKTLGFPRDSNELIQQLSHNYLVYYDNISGIPPWISDQLCRAVTGSGFSKRALYTDDDDVIRSFMRCVGFNGINLAATKADLLDRGLIVKLERIIRNKQRKPKELWRVFEDIRPKLLGYIFDTLVKVLNWKNNGPALNLKELPRMSEFAEYGEIIARVMGYEENKFTNAYNKNIEKQTEEVLESSPVAICLRYMMFEKYADMYNLGHHYKEENQKAWIGTPTSLLAELEAVAEFVKVNPKSKYWPKMAHIMSRRLKEVEINLKESGIEIKWDQDKDKRRIIRIQKIASATSELSESEAKAQNADKNEDAPGDATENV